MGSIVEHHLRRTPVVLASLAGALLVVLLPSLQATGVDGASAIAVLAIACAALVHLGVRVLALGPRSPLVVVASRRETEPLRPGRVTDPTHHPLRPRAPGTA
jgi:lysylphosphatidylglycerol synthetase-like protein (DUF2156 family)